ncbi:hypothetical protein SALBM217S_00005 [Streptomyces griseoloalbus]
MHDAGDKAARHIKDVVHHDAVRDPGGFMNFLAMVMLSNISAVLSVLAVICAFVPPLQFLVPIFATLAVIASAAALAGHAYDMTVRGGEGRLVEAGGADALGVLPGLGALKGFKALKGVKGLTKFRFSGLAALDGVGHNFLNGVAVKLTNKVLGRTAQAAAIDGKKITGVIKGAWPCERPAPHAESGDRCSGRPPGAPQGHRAHAPAHSHSHARARADARATAQPPPRPSVSPTAFNAARGIGHGSPRNRKHMS